MAETSVNVVPISATIRADQRDRLLSFAKHSGAISISEALRDVLDIALPPMDEHGQTRTAQEHDTDGNGGNG